MKYHSTRSKRSYHSFTDIILEGLAPDGGLYIPENIPQLDTETLSTFRDLSYADLAFNVMRLYVGGSIPKEDLKKLCHDTYKETVFNSKAIAPIEHLEDNIYLQDLSAGPSLAFKDMAMQFLGHLLDYELKRRNEKLCILGASSGDTVSAAEEALKGKEQINVVMLTPKEGMSPFQKAQAGSILDDNILNVSVPGPFDTCQDIVKEINADLDFKRKYKIGAVNSINWGRILAQIIYYISAYIQVTDNNDQEIDVVVPTGNFGNILAGYYAKQMGIKIRRLIVATNENNVLHNFIQTGIYKQLDVHVTSSPSMDISKASNLERFLYDLAGKNDDTLNNWMTEFNHNKEIDLSAHLGDLNSQFNFDSGVATHSERQETISYIYKSTKRIIDPHTAAGIKVAKELSDNETPMICMETAKPSKFESTVSDAIGFVPDRPKTFIGLEDKKQRFFNCDANSDSIKTFIVKNITI